MQSMKMEKVIANWNRRRFLPQICFQNCCAAVTWSILGRVLRTFPTDFSLILSQILIETFHLSKQLNISARSSSSTHFASLLPRTARDKWFIWINTLWHSLGLRQIFPQLLITTTTNRLEIPSRNDATIDFDSSASAVGDCEHPKTETFVQTSDKFVFEDARHFWDFSNVSLTIFCLPYNLESFKLHQKQSEDFSHRNLSRQMKKTAVKHQNESPEAHQKEFKNRKTESDFYFNLMNSRQWMAKKWRIRFHRFASNGIKSPKTVVDGGEEGWK